MCKDNAVPVRFFVSLCLELDIHFRACHVLGVDNSIADALSRFQMDRFHRSTLGADPVMTPLPGNLWTPSARSARIAVRICSNNRPGNFTRNFAHCMALVIHFSHPYNHLFNLLHFCQLISMLLPSLHLAFQVLRFRYCVAFVFGWVTRITKHFIVSVC